MKHLSAIGLLAACLFVTAATTDASGPQRLAIRVSPAMAMAPAALTVRATIEPNDDNRALNITIDSASYHRTSEISLDGKAAQRTSTFELRDVPTGLYEVRATLLGPSGELATAMQLVKVQPAPGHDR